MSVFAKTPVNEVHPELSEAERFAAQSVANEPEDAPAMFGSPVPQRMPLPPVAKPHAAPVQHTGPKAGRNDPCPCGSGKKYKKCHGQ